jgi:hypothetical protein
LALDESTEVDKGLLEMGDDPYTKGVLKKLDEEELWRAGQSVAVG